MGCVFCAIVAGEAPASLVYEDEKVLVFLDINPINPGHTLVIPKAHYANLAELDPTAGMDLFRVAQQIAAAVRESGVRCEGVNIFLADGEAAFQDVFHVHLHVMPRYKGDAFRISADWSQRPARSELDEVAAQIRARVR